MVAGGKAGCLYVVFAALMLTGCPTPTVVVSISVSGAGYVELEPPGGGYEPGTVLTLRAVPDSDRQFDHWQGDLAGSENPVTVVLEQDLTVTAVFVETPGEGEGEGEGESPFDYLNHLAPQAIIYLYPEAGPAPLRVTLDGSLSSGDWQIVAYDWDVDGSDGIQQDYTTPVAEHVYDTPGQYRVSLTVTDINGNQARDDACIRVGDGLPTLSASADTQAGAAPLTVQFSVSAHDPEGQDLTYSWDFGDGMTSGEQNPVHIYAEDIAAGAYETTVTATDPDGNRAESSVDIVITNVEPLAFATVTPGEGGTLVVDYPGSYLDGASVTVPAGAVSKPTIITIGAVDPPPSFAPACIEVRPDIHFAQPVTVDIPLSRPLKNANEVKVVFHNRHTKIARKEGVSNITYVAQPEPRVRFDTTHCSFWTIIGGLTVTMIPTLGGTSGKAYGINNANPPQVVGESYVWVSANWHWAYIWDSVNGLSRELGNATAALDFKHSYAFAVNDVDPAQVVGYLQHTRYATDHHAFIWDTTNGMEDIGTLDGYPTIARDINDSGEVVGYSTGPTGDYRAFLWDAANGMQDLGDLGGAAALAYGINDNSEVAGAAQTATGQFHAFLWDATNGMQNLGTLGGTSSMAFDVNNGTQVVGKSDVAGGNHHAFFWPALFGGGMLDLDTLGGDNSTARAVDNGGTPAVVGRSDTATGECHGFVCGVLFRFIPLLYDLNDLLPDGSNWVITDACDVNNNGDIAAIGKIRRADGGLGLAEPLLLESN